MKREKRSINSISWKWFESSCWKILFWDT